MGNDNTAVGDHALTSQTGEGPNTAVGSGALFNNTLGDSNTANGTFALFNNTVGDSNTATGFKHCKAIAWAAPTLPSVILRF
jgi:trimeric autotransporter adhesin